MPFTGPREDHLAIRELYETNADGGSRRDRAAWLACYAPDARWKSPYFDLTGHAAIGAMFDEIMAGVVDTTFFVQIGAIEVTHDRARCRLQQAESLLYADGSTYELVGQYQDELVRRDGRWLFLDRDYALKREQRPLPAARFSGPPADRAAIRELHATYADAASRRDKQQWLDCWTDDAVWVTSMGEVRGKAALAERWDQLFTTMDALAFLSMTGAVAVRGDRATACDHVREIARIDGQVLKFAARYDDELVRTANGWRFARRGYAMNIAE
ncbi:nuclear transport factor 2 family protein [Novosphingobium album (ex Liu et al. 2023)]|uniref:Nuclear transport factor 2 family protein n=1 Tax=Novosphingobium album (ex Liu et al. 2023) TaxID=3031130 RepID=A0ABT5WM64_9SPHN|nr:nuclear transport factor 2 family protein [Novosphingobium album (ex Liu et al. 2023)]MDE8651139.1 nuclear transport factor 2 family protein [Novosphingobium album (ex Liu et al. 2023)]